MIYALHLCCLLAASLLCVPGCQQQCEHNGQDSPPQVASKVDEPLYPYGGPSFQDIERIGNPYAGADEFLKVLEEVYCDPENCETWFKARRKGFSFAGRTIPWNTPPTGAGKNWRTAAEMPPMTSREKPLEGVRIGVDAGHIGGKWARIEYRDNMIGGKYRVREGNSTQLVAELLARELKKYGAEVLLVRDGMEPVSQLTSDIIAKRLAQRRNQEVTPELQREANQWFVRRVEINARAAKLKKFKPDLTVCLHFDAGNETKPVNRLHLLVNGAYTKGEIEDDELRTCMIAKILSRVYPEEVALSSSVAGSMHKQLKLEVFSYGVRTESLRPVPEEPFLWCRNLLANCLYPGPVVYTEPYAMNDHVTARRMIVGDYEGTLVFSGKRYRSIYREYAESVAEGIKNHFLNNRGVVEK